MLLDLRFSKILRFGKEGKLEVLVDILNSLDDAAEFLLITDNFFGPNFAEPDRYIDPRRAMFGVKLAFWAAMAVTSGRVFRAMKKTRP